MGVVVVRRRAPMWASPFWLIAVFLAAGTVAAPFYWLWHPLGWVVAVVAYTAMFAGLVAHDRARRVVPAAAARASVRSPRD